MQKIIKMKTFNVTITTIGRTSLTTMINSIYPQLNKEDYLTILCDCKLNIVTPLITECLEKAVCTVTIIQNSEVLGFVGHASRSKWQNKLHGDYIMYGDDDDVFTPDAMQHIRQLCVSDTIFYIFPMWWRNRNFPNRDVIECGNISTSCGVVPNKGNLPDWGMEYCGDFVFYKRLSQIMAHELTDKITYLIKGKE